MPTPTTAASLGVPATRVTADGGRPNSHGNHLIDTICIPTACVIVNGRAPHTASGGFTFEGGQGSSCIDYCIADAHLFSHIRSLTIIPHQGRSDHNALLCTIPKPITHPTPTAGPRPPTQEPEQPPPRPRFKEEHRAEYAAALMAPRTAAALTAATQLSDISAAAAALAATVRAAATAVFGVSAAPAARRQARGEQQQQNQRQQQQQQRQSQQHQRPQQQTQQPPQQPPQQQQQPQQPQQQQQQQQQQHRQDRRLSPWARAFCRAALRQMHSSRRHGSEAEYRAARQDFRRRLRYARRREQAQQQQQLKHQFVAEPSKFWRAIQQRDDAGAAAGPTAEALGAHFSSVLGGEGRGALAESEIAFPRLPPTPTSVEELARRLEAAADCGALSSAQRDAAAALNRQISLAETADAIDAMRQGAAASLDAVGPDLLKGAEREVIDAEGRRRRENVLVPHLHALYCRVFEEGYPDCWLEQPLTAVYKGKGPRTDPANYRPIQNLSAIAKGYHIIIQRRLDAFAETRRLRAEGQMGFRRQRRTTDGVFVLRHLADRARLRRGDGDHRVFCCFVDFRQAYDSVPRDKLFSFLASLGIHSYMLTTLASMYWRVPVRPKCNGRVGAPFLSTSGVRQGDPISPLLFGLYLDRLEAFLAQRAPRDGIMLGGRYLHCLLYADDTALLAPTSTSLQTLLNLLSEFCNANGLQVNLSKTEMVVFAPNKWRPRPLSEPHPTYNGEPVPLSDAFKYLGITLHRRDSVSPAPRLLKKVAVRAAHAVNARCATLNITNFALRLHLFKALVLSIINYGAEVWSPAFLTSFHTAMHAEPQVVQNDFIRRLGGLRRSVPTYILCEETRLPPLAVVWLQASGVLWHRAFSSNTPTLLRRAAVEDVALTNLLWRDGGACPRTWCGDWLRALDWLARAACDAAQPIRAHITALRAAGTDTQAIASLPPLNPTFLVNAFTSIYAQHTGAALAEGGGALTPYAANFLPVPGDWQRRPGLKPLLPFLYSDTESFPTLEHARALMRARCISDPFSACLTTARGARSASEHPHCTRCNTQQPLALEHALFDCPHSDILRNLSCFSHLYAASSPTGARRMRTLFTHTDQSTLSALVQHCYSLWEST